MSQVTYLICFSVDLSFFGDFPKEVRNELLVTSDEDAEKEFRIFVKRWPEMFDGKRYHQRPRLVKETILAMG